MTEATFGKEINNYREMLLINYFPLDVICKDFTKRQKLKGEWPSFLINIINIEELHVLRPLVLGNNCYSESIFLCLNLPSENRDQISKISNEF